MIILGDTGINYYGPKESKDFFRRQFIAEQNITLFCIRGNHERRPENYGTYKLVDKGIGDMVYIDENFPNIWFAQDGGIYNFNGQRYLTIGGAYSVDKEYRLSRGYMWFPDEQLTTKEWFNVIQKIATEGRYFDHILTHTAPLSQEPTWLFLDGIDQDKVDKTMEKHLEAISQMAHTLYWWFGHYHGDKVWFDDENGRNYALLYHSIYEIKDHRQATYVGEWRT